MARRRRRRRRRLLGEVSIRRACPREGLRVEYNPSPASHVLYSDYPTAPRHGERGTVVSIPLGGRRATCLRGPGGGLVYVKWDRAGHAGVSSYDLDRVKR
jgi:hypothetical protein